MAVLPYGNRTIVDFIGPEGSKLDTMKIGRGGQSTRPLYTDLSEDELMRRLSVARDVEATGGLSPDAAEDYANIRAELDKRNQARAGADEGIINDIFGGQPVPTNVAQSAMGGTSAPQFDVQSAIRDAQESAAGQRKAIGDVFQRSFSSGSQAIQDAFAPIRGQVIDEQAALGSRLLSPVGQATIGAVDAQKGRAFSDLANSLAVKRSESEAGIENTLGERTQRAREFGTTAGLQGSELGLRERLGAGDLGLREKLGRAGLIQSGRQFGQTFGLEREKFAEGKRQGSLADLRETQRQEAARELGRLQAKANEGDWMDDFGKVAGGIGQIAGGIASAYTGNPIGAVSGVAGGLSSLSARKKAPVASDVFNPPESSIRARSGFTPRY